MSIMSSRLLSSVLRETSDEKQLIKCCSYNKTEKDFTTKREYNDYLEEAEDISQLPDTIWRVHS